MGCFDSHWIIKSRQGASISFLEEMQPLSSSYCLSLKAKHLSCWTYMDFRILEIYFSMSCFHFDFPFKVFSGTDREAILRRFKVVTSDTLPPPAPEEVTISWSEYYLIKAKRLGQILTNQLLHTSVFRWGPSPTCHDLSGRHWDQFPGGRAGCWCWG